MEIDVTFGGGPSPQEVGELYRAASAGPPLHEPPQTAEVFTDVYRASLPNTTTRVVAARAPDGGLAGLAYGCPWSWSQEDYPWAHELSDRLGPQAAPRLEGALAVCLLAVHPEHQRRGLARQLLARLLDTARERGPAQVLAWLQTTDAETPARALYRSAGWTPLGHGPDAPDGRPGLVMVLVDR